jgi:hypothetical protein
VTRERLELRDQLAFQRALGRPMSDKDKAMLEELDDELRKELADIEPLSSDVSEAMEQVLELANDAPKEI